MRRELKPFNIKNLPSIEQLRNTPTDDLEYPVIYKNKLRWIVDRHYGGGKKNYVYLKDNKGKPVNADLLFEVPKPPKYKIIAKNYIENNNKGSKTKINEGQEKGNIKNVTTQRPNVQPAPQKPTQTGKK